MNTQTFKPEIGQAPDPAEMLKGLQSQNQVGGMDFSQLLELLAKLLTPRMGGSNPNRAPDPTLP